MTEPKTPDGIEREDSNQVETKPTEPWRTSLVERIPALMEVLSFKRVIFLSLLGIMSVFLLIVYEQQESIVNGIKMRAVGLPGNRVLIANAETTSYIHRIVERHELIVGVQLVAWNKSANTRDTILFYSDVPALQTAVDKAVFQRVVPAPPLFGAPRNQTPEEQEFARINTERDRNIVNSIFACYDSKGIVLARDVPILPMIAPVVCSLSIPPFAGNFQGYLNLMLLRKPIDDNELAQLESIARNLSNNIFSGDK